MFEVTGTSLAQLTAEQVGAFAGSSVFARMQAGRMQTRSPARPRVGGLLIKARIDALGAKAAGVRLLVDNDTNAVDAGLIADAPDAYVFAIHIYALAALSVG